MFVFSEEDLAVYSGPRGMIGVIQEKFFRCEAQMTERLKPLLRATLPQTCDSRQRLQLADVVTVTQSSFFMLIFLGATERAWCHWVTDSL